MKPDITQICFGLSEEKDRKSLSTILQLAGRKDFSDLLTSRMNSEEIDSFFNQIMLVLRKHLKEDEYHTAFLLDEDHHH